jgi:hypothetical protein
MAKNPVKKMVEATIDLKREGKSVAHYFGEDGVKDLYIPLDTFKALGGAKKVKVTIEVAK